MIKLHLNKPTKLKFKNYLRERGEGMDGLAMQLAIVSFFISFLKQLVFFGKLKISNLHATGLDSLYNV